MFIMLLSIAGGVLAFNAYLKNGNLFCTSVQGDYCDSGKKFKQDFNGSLMYCSTIKDDCCIVTEQTRVFEDPR